MTSRGDEDAGERLAHARHANPSRSADRVDRSDPLTNVRSILRSHSGEDGVRALTKEFAVIAPRPTNDVTLFTGRSSDVRPTHFYALLRALRLCGCVVLSSDTAMLGAPRYAAWVTVVHSNEGSEFVFETARKYGGQIEASVDSVATLTLEHAADVAVLSLQLERVGVEWRQRMRDANRRSKMHKETSTKARESSADG